MLSTPDFVGLVVVVAVADWLVPVSKTHRLVAWSYTSVDLRLNSDSAEVVFAFPNVFGFQAGDSAIA